MFGLFRRSDEELLGALEFLSEMSVSRELPRIMRFEVRAMERCKGGVASPRCRFRRRLEREEGGEGGAWRVFTRLPLLVDVGSFPLSFEEISSSSSLHHSIIGKSEKESSTVTNRPDKS
jgi:hypothetical protein